MIRNLFKKATISIGIVICFVAIITMIWVGNANAAVGGVYQKVAATSLITCYQTNQFISPRQKSDFKKSDISNLMNGSQKIWDSTGTKSVKCSNFVKGLLGDKKVAVPGPKTNDTDFGTFMTNMGYNKGNVTGTGKCISFEYSANDYGKLSTPKLCASSITNMGNGAVNSAIEIVDANSVNKQLINYTYNAKTGKLQIKCPTSICGTIIISQGSTAWSDVEAAVKQAVLSGRNSARVKIGRYYNFGLDGLDDGSSMKVSPYGEVTAEYTVSANEDSLKRATNYLIGTQYGSKPVFLGNEHFVLYQNYLLDFFGGNNDIHCNWDTEDQKMAYVKDYHRAVKLYQNGTMKTCYINTKKMTNKNAKVGGIDGGGVFGTDCNLDCVLSWLDANTMNYTGLESLGIINPVDTENPNPSDPTPTPTPSPSEPGATDNSIVDCDSIKTEDGSKVGAMKWILCPTANNLQYTANTVDSMTKEMLEVDEDRYSTNSPTYTAWSYMRNIANVLMIVFLLVIIFSQVTGYGIDNYGIKKMLPRLIVMALIVNLSFYICELAIDLSNIVGVGLRNMFGSIGNEMAGEQLNGANFMKTMFVGLFTAIGTGGTAAVSAGVAVSTVASASLLIPAIIAVIVLVLVVLVAIMIMFLMLAARNIIVIVCVALSPLAFAAFVLPNTQNIFKKWWDLFKAAIIIFPICGAMSGVSNMLRGMSFENGDGGLITHAMNGAQFAIMFLLPYLSFFLLPALLKNALSALGKIGGALTAMGQSVRNSGRAIGQNAMRLGQGSDWYKNRQQETARRRQEQVANRNLRRYGDANDIQARLDEAKRRMEADPDNRRARREYERALTDQRRAARASETLRRLGNEDTAARTILTEKQYADTSRKDMEDMWFDALRSGDTDRRVALENVITSRFGPGGVSGMASRLKDVDFFNDKGDFIGGDNGVMAKSFRSLQTNLMQNSALANAMQNKASDAYQMITSGGYVKRNEAVKDANGNVIHDTNGKPMMQEVNTRANLATHSANNGIATQHKDWATQSTATLQRAIESGALTESTIRDILDSNDPAIVSGLKTDADKLRVLQAAAAGYNGDWNDAKAIEEASQSYAMGKIQSQALSENRDFDVRTANAQMARQQAEDTRAMRQSLERQNGEDNNGG